MKKLICFAAFLLLAALLIPLGNTFLVQLDTFAAITMRDIRSRDDIELAIVGSSIVQHHFNPEIITEKTGLKAFDVTITNMVMPDILALTRELYRTNHPEWVVLVLEAYSFDTIKTDPQTQMKLMPHLTDPRNRLRYYRDIIQTDGNYLSRLLLFNTFGFSSLEDVQKAIRLRLDPDGFLEEMLEQSGGAYAYKDGFVRREEQTRAEDELVRTVIREETGYEYALYDYTREKLLEYKALCEQNGSKLMVVLAPGMTAHALAEPGYLPFMESAMGFFAENGIPCFNLMYAKPSFLPRLDHLYFDLYHMVGEGADILSAAFSDLFCACLAGEDVSGWFYPNAGEYLASIDFVTNVWLTRQDGADGQVILSADCNRGTNVVVEYRFVLRAQDGSETLLRDYDADPVFSCPPEALAAGTAGVYARAQGSGQSVFFELREP
ncbi:MAG: hypothetical protein Q4G52_02170 [Clostridia bacterium]|nr:hypothetical protein [Clostridia bacterium]